ncbi:MAG: hypothetical protein HY823_10810 [Acidobacteria bacterium]|nr:hypothetical protein [Acidobacteriota bacterium]
MSWKALFPWLLACSCLAQEGARGLELYGLGRWTGQGWGVVVAISGPEVLGLRDPRWLRLAAAGVSWRPSTPARIREELSREGVEAPLARWLLKDPAGHLQTHGDGSLDTEGIEGAIRRVQGKLPWDHLDAVLRGHPGHGEAQLARLEWALAMAFVPADPGTPSPPAFPSRAGLAYVRECFGDFLKVPGWPAQVNLSRGALKDLGTAVDTGRDSLVARHLLEALAQDPGDPLVQDNLAWLLNRTGPSDLDALAKDWLEVEPLPGQAWPPLPLLRAHLDRLLGLRRHGDVIALARSWSRPPGRLFLTDEAWEAHVHREALLVAYLCIAETPGDPPPSRIREGLDRIREVAGKHARQLGRFFLSRIRLPEDPGFRAQIPDLLRRPDLPPPPRPAPIPTWRISAASRESLETVRAHLDEDPDLILWLPLERGLNLAPGQPSSVSLWLGPDPVPGPENPGPAWLADSMARGRPGRLREAMAHAAAAPEREGRRRFRIPLLLERMPARHLENVLAEDLRRVRGAADLGDIGADPNLWWAEAQRALPEIEEGLRHWPLDADRWEAMAFWSGFVPRHPGPAALASELPPWQPRLPFRLALPAGTHGRVARQLARQKAWGQLLAWAEAPMEDLGKLRPEDFRTWPWLEATAGALRGALDRAYEALGRQGDRRALQERFLALPFPRETRVR